MPETTATKAHKERQLEGVRITVDPPSWLCRSRQIGGQAYYVDQVEQWVKEFNDWLRDHRSQDDVTLTVDRQYAERCSECGTPWEPAPGKELDPEGLEYEADTLYCAACGVPIEEAENV